jgi:hypothetical protein
LEEGWLGTLEQREAVEQMFNVRISAEQGLWAKNFWSPLASDPEVNAPGRTIAEMLNYTVETPALADWLVATPCSPLYQLGAFGLRAPALEFFDSLYLEHYNTASSPAMDAAKRRAMPPSAAWQIVGYVAPDVRIVRQLFPGRGLDAQGLPLDVRDAPREGGGPLLERFWLARGRSRPPPGAAATAAEGGEWISYSLTSWGNHLALVVTERIHRL